MTTRYEPYGPVILLEYHVGYLEGLLNEISDELADRNLKWDTRTELNSDFSLVQNDLAATRSALEALKPKDETTVLGEITLSTIGKRITVVPFEGSTVTGTLRDLAIYTEIVDNYSRDIVRVTKTYTVVLRHRGTDISLDNLTDNTKVIVHEPSPI